MSYHDQKKATDRRLEGALGEGVVHISPRKRFWKQMKGCSELITLELSNPGSNLTVAFCVTTVLGTFGGTCQSPALPALVRPPAPPLQPSLDIKPFLPFPLDTAAAVNLFPNFNASLKAYVSCMFDSHHGFESFHQLNAIKRLQENTKVHCILIYVEVINALGVEFYPR
ncbi:zinc finger protein [Cricetulus griseus]|nr:zinc finger protein [Cricetulus griseus]